MRLESRTASQYQQLIGEGNLLLLSQPAGNNEGRMWARWEECAFDNLPKAWSESDGRIYTLRIDQLAEAIFINPGLSMSIISVIDKNLKIT